MFAKPAFGRNGPHTIRLTGPQFSTLDDLTGLSKTLKGAIKSVRDKPCPPMVASQSAR